MGSTKRRRGPELRPRERIDDRQVWAATRFWMETENIKSRRYGGRSHHHWYALAAATHCFAWALERLGQYERGRRNAMALTVHEIEHTCERLPAAFDGFRILQLSDLHIDGMPGLDEAILRALGDRAVDLCVLTGDYRSELHGPIAPALAAMERVVRGIRSRHGVLGILGNHDTCQMVDPLEDMGVHMLINEAIRIELGEASIAVVGTDDVHYYYTDQAVHALEWAPAAPFRVALVHSPELYDVACDHGIDLYLCGHTHGGQICLPGGRPIIKHLTRGHEFFRGAWRYKDMVGFTHSGTGTSGIPVRFNTRGELAIHVLRALGS